MREREMKENDDVELINFSPGAPDVDLNCFALGGLTKETSSSYF